MKDPYTEQNLIILNDSDSSAYVAPLDYSQYPFRRQFQSIGLLLCQADPDNNQFSPDLSGPNYSTKHFAIKATLSSGETIFQTLDFVHLISAIQACGA
jgi:hypothetical protein